MVMDKDLEFLKELTNEDLAPLVDVLKDRWLTDLIQDAISNPKEHVELITNDILTYAGNSIINFFRGGGVSYREMLCDVCKKLKVTFVEDDSIESIEQGLRDRAIEELFKKMSDEDKNKFFGDAIDKMTDEEKDEFIKKVTGDENWKGNPKFAGIFSMSGQQIIALLVKVYGIKIYYGAVKLLVWFFHTILLRTAPKWLVFLLPWLIKRFISGPLMILMIAWSLFDIASPAYRVTIPSAICISFLRLTKLAEQK